MKRVLFAALFIATGWAATAQWSVGINGTISTAIGKYGATASGDDDGYAMTGVGVNAVDVQWQKPDGIIGFSGTFGVAVHDINLDEFNDDAGFTLEIEDPYSVGYLLLGMSARMELSDVSELTGRFYVGSLFMTTPSVTYSGTVIAEESDADSGYLAGLGVDYTHFVSDNIGIYTGLDLLNGSASWDDDDDAEQPVNMLNLKLGFKYRF